MPVIRSNIKIEHVCKYLNSELETDNIKSNPERINLAHTVLISSIKFPDNILHGDRYILVKKIIEVIATKTRITEGELEKLIKAEWRKFKRTTPQNFTVVTKVSINNTGNLPRRTVNGVQISMVKSLNSRFSKERTRQLGYTTGWVKEYEEKHQIQYYWIKAKTSGRSYFEAVEKAIRSINTLFGIWNFYLLSGVGHLFRSHDIGPINKILVGPNFSIHYSDKEKHLPAIFYESTFSPPHMLQSNRFIEEWNSINLFEKKTRRQIKSSPVELLITESFEKYYVALSQVNVSDMFWRLWEILENLTSHENEKTVNATLIKRAAFQYTDPNLHKLVLNCLSNIRNDYLHKAESKSELMPSVDLLKRFVERLIRFYVKNPHDFKTQNEFLNFFDLPTDVEMLKEKRELIKKAIKFRRG